MTEVSRSSSAASRTAAVLAAAVLVAASFELSAIAQTRLSDAMVVDFRALGSDGRLISDLKADEVQFKIDGRVRPVKSLEWISAGQPPSSEPGAAPAVVPPPFGSNVDTDSGRTFVVVIENDSFRPGRERPLREAVDLFVSALSPRDRLALLTMPYGDFRVPLTTDHARFRDELAKVSGQRSPNESGSEMACRTRRTIEALVGLVSGFSASESPSYVLFVTSGMAGPRRDASLAFAPGMCELRVDLFTQLGVAATAARTAFYVIQPEEVMIKPGAGTTAAGSDNPLEGIEHLAGVTGAERLQLAATGSTTLLRIARETAGYYRLAFDLQSGDRSNALRPMDIRVTREGISVRSRTSVMIPKPDTRPAVKSQTVTPRSMIRESRAFRDLPLRGVGYVSPTPGDDKLKIVCLMEPIEPSTKLTAASAGLFDSGGRLVAQWSADAAALTGTTVIGALVASKPGTYRLRVAATDDAGRSGSADSEVVAEVPTVGGLKLSSLVLGLSRGGFMPRMLFGNEPVALGYFDVYGKVDGSLTAAAEIASSVTGPALGTAIPITMRAVSGEDRFMATFALPIGALAAGDYVVRVTVSAPGQPAARLVRTLRKAQP